MIFFNRNNLLALGGHAVFVILSVMSLWFWQERTLILDAAFQSYLLVATGQPAIMVERFGAAAVQFLPLLGVWAGASLKTVLMLYSASFVLFQWAIFSICLHALKDKSAALFLLLFNILLAGDSFYWIQNELLQAIAWMGLLWALWKKWGEWQQWKTWQYVLSSALMVTVAYLHPLIVFPLAFVWAFYWLGKVHSRPFLLGVGAAFGLIFASKYLLREPNFYDRGMIGQFAREFDFSWEKLLGAQSLRDFLAHCSENLLFFFPLLATILLFYGIRQQWLKAGLVLSFTVGYCFLIMLRFWHDDRWYIQESHYQALAVFLLVPLIWDIMPAVSTSRNWAVLLAGVLLFRIYGIFTTHATYTDRLGYVQGWINKASDSGARKLVADAQQLAQKTLMMTWGLPFETLQMSALKSPDSVCVVAVAKNKAAMFQPLPSDTMVTFLMIPAIAFKDLPSRYYRMPASTNYLPVEQ